MNWIRELFTKGLDQIGQAVEKVYMLSRNIDSIQFTEDTYIFKFFGLIRFIIGDTLYIFLSLIIEIGIGFLLYKLLIKLIDIFVKVLERMKIKFTL